MPRRYGRKTKKTYAKVTLTVNIKRRGKKPLKIEKPLNLSVTEDDIKKIKARAKEEGYIISSDEK